MKHFRLNALAAMAQEPVWDGNKVILEAQKLVDGVFAVIPKGAAEMANSSKSIAVRSRQ